jgi:DNA (cytosine-5)-methyltransferase 1
MSLPDDFILTGRWEQRSERMGRMVPPFMLKAVAEAVYENILKPYKENEGG